MNIASALLWLHVARLILHTYGASAGCMRIFKAPAVKCAAAGPRLTVLGVMTCPSTATVQSFVSNGKNATDVDTNLAASSQLCILGHVMEDYVSFCKHPYFNSGGKDFAEKRLMIALRTVL